MCIVSCLLEVVSQQQNRPAQSSMTTFADPAIIISRYNEKYTTLHQDIIINNEKKDHIFNVRFIHEDVDHDLCEQ